MFPALLMLVMLKAIVILEIVVILVIIQTLLIHLILKKLVIFVALTMHGYAWYACDTCKICHHCVGYVRCV